MKQVGKTGNFFNHSSGWKFLLIPVLLFVAIGTWAFASPVSSSPDDDFHMVSIWCSGAGVDHICEPSGDPGTRNVSPALLESRCFVFLPKQSAACQQDLQVFGNRPLVESDRGSFSSNYPPLYYAFMHLFAGGNVPISVLVMRLINVLIFVLLNAWLWRLVPRNLHKTQLFMWLITMLPLGVFLVASINPSSWAITGVGISWLSVYALMQDSDRIDGSRRVQLYSLFILSSVMAAGARADAAIYVVVGIIVSYLLTIKGKVHKLAKLSIPAMVVAVCLVSFFTAGQSAVIEGGLPPESRTVVPPESLSSQIALLVGNLIQIPSLILGIFGYWKLGWSDTEMPIFTWVVVGMIFAGVIFSAFQKMPRLQAWISASLATLLLAIPLYVLQKSLVPVGTQVQPRYVLPLLLIFAGVVLLPSIHNDINFSFSQALIISAGLWISFSLALHFNIRRYVTGEDVNNPNLNTNVEWWWANIPSPMFFWLLGTVSFGVLMFAFLLFVRFDSEQLNQQQIQKVKW